MTLWHRLVDPKEEEKPRSIAATGVLVKAKASKRSLSTYLVERASHNRRPLSTALLIKARRPGPRCSSTRLCRPCGRVFYLCAHCDRGQVCCKECRYWYRRSQCNEANREYQDKCRRQLLQATKGLPPTSGFGRKKKVTDQGLGNMAFLSGKVTQSRSDGFKGNLVAMLYLWTAGCSEP